MSFPRFLLFSITLTVTPLFAAKIDISSLAELEHYAAESGNDITLRPGHYRLIDLIPLNSIRERRERKQWPFFVFSGSDNTFNLTNVVIEHDTALRAALHPPVHTNEFVVTGARNTLSGLTINCIGDGASPGGALVSVDGDDNTLRDCTFTVRGSFPYAYGDIFGKGTPAIIHHLKHSGVHIVGNRTRVLGCKVFMRSFGHAFYVQGGSNQNFENCLAEGEMRSTTTMLAETSGPAFDAGFRTMDKNRNGEFKVLPGYMKSLAEDGFRTYTDTTGIVFKNCVAKNMRGGFELRTKQGAHIEKCSALGCERGFWVSEGAEIISSQGDAAYGPLLFVEGNNARIELEVLPTASDAIVHALALIQGSGHTITFTASAKGPRPRPLPIRLGFCAPGAGNGMGAIPERPASNIILRNQTTMPVEISPLVASAKVASRGLVTPASRDGLTIQTIH